MTVKDLITILLEYNMEDLVQVEDRVEYTYTLQDIDIVYVNTIEFEDEEDEHVVVIRTY
jgi:hypothetical protein